MKKLIGKTVVVVITVVVTLGILSGAFYLINKAITQKAIETEIEFRLKEERNAEIDRANKIIEEHNLRFDRNQPTLRPQP